MSDCVPRRGWQRLSPSGIPLRDFLVPFLLLIIYNGVAAIGAFRRFKKEEMQELDEEKKKIEEERRQSLEMMAELQKLKEQLAAQQGTTVPAADAAPKTDTNTED